MIENGKFGKYTGYNNIIIIQRVYKVTIASYARILARRVCQKFALWLMEEKSGEDFQNTTPFSLFYYRNSISLVKMS